MDTFGNDMATAGSAHATCGISGSGATLKYGATGNGDAAHSGGAARGCNAARARPQRHSLAGRCGIPREDERVYVDVEMAVVHAAPGLAAARPARARWPDGRSWQIQGVYSLREFGRRELGNLCQRWDVEVQGCRRTIWWEHGDWFVAKGSGLAEER